MNDQILIQLADYLRQKIIDNYIAQGHRMTGTFAETLKVVLKTELLEKIIEGTGEYYATFLDKGVSGGNINFNPGSGKKHSKYIEGLQAFAEIKMGLSGKEALGAAFAIAHTQKKEGMPTIGSFHYSKTGLRTRFLTDALSDSRKHIGLEIERWGGRKIETTINNMIRNYERSI